MEGITNDIDSQNVHFLGVQYDLLPKCQVAGEIVMPLTNPPLEDTDELHKNHADIDQSLVYGIMCPIICIAGLVVSYEDIIDFELRDNEHIPSMKCHVYDNKNIIQQLTPPSQGNTIINVQILPTHDIYKKININFIMTSFSVGSDNDLYISGDYLLPDFVSKKFKSFGELSLWDLFDTIAKEINIGYVTNVKEKENKRYVFCNYSSYMDLIDKETACTGEEQHIYDWFIDAWHYLTLEDIYNRYNALDNIAEVWDGSYDPDAKTIREDTPITYIWITNQNQDATAGVELQPYRTRVLLTNLFGFENSQVFIKDYRVINDIGAEFYGGVDKVYSVYSSKDKKYEDILFEDENAQENTAVSNFEYKGEVYGEYDYIKGSLYKNLFFQKMKKEVVEVDLQSPLLGLTRGRQVVLSIYQNEGDINASYNAMEKDGIKKPYTELSPEGRPIELIENDEESQSDDHFKLDKSLSTQYLIIGNIYKFSNHEWTHTVQLVRPDDRKYNLMNT